MADSPVVEMFREKKLLYVCAPMVRYSKLAFRTLVRRYCCDLCFTPMIIADSFIRSPEARQSEFTTSEGDRPLIVQFASNDPHQFATAAEMVARYCDGVDLNCGCPQSWAMSEGYGAHLLNKPHLVRDMVLQVRNRISSSFTVSVKLRIMDDLRKTVDLCRMLESSGISFITVHARTPKQKHQAINIDALSEIKNSIGVPLIANGDVKTTEGALNLQNQTGCNGVMAARGILTNPAMFANYMKTPADCIQDWISISTENKTSYQCFHHHLVFMLEKVLPKPKRLIFNLLRRREDVLQFLEEYGIPCKNLYHIPGFSKIECEFNEMESSGKYFSERMNGSLDADEQDSFHLNNLYD